jgi:hypothetical protein
MKRQLVFIGTLGPRQPVLLTTVVWVFACIALVSATTFLVQP